ncbi:DUF1702 family protein [Flavobacteriales bacterium]|nr:DUF1702 family protein [Flavobacteriales bacterium]
MSIEDNIQTVVDTFQKGRSISEQELGLDELISTLNEFEPRYRSVAFEGASMGVALGNEVSTWKKYAEKTKKHATQVNIGFGWAIAEQDLELVSTLIEIEPKMRIKVLDGFGYWHGLFRRRLTIRTQSIPENITTEFQTGFDQGVGRAIWYISKGEIAKSVHIIRHFPEERRSNLWQGIGVASTYVGGCSDDLIFELKTAAGEFKSNVEKGIKAAGESIKKAKS